MVVAAIMLEYTMFFTIAVVLKSHRTALTYDIIFMSFSRAFDLCSWIRKTIMIH